MIPINRVFTPHVEESTLAPVPDSSLLTREERIARARLLAIDPNYPSREVIREVASRILCH
ncbi:MAG: hypothetical protein AAGA45_03295 [Verrucomicrobiota bacterium]